MAPRSHIEWTQSTWNPTTGCTKVSPGCQHCYAERMALRLRAMGQYKYRNGFELTLHEWALDAPLSWKRPQVIFVDSMSDLFHSHVPSDFVGQVFSTMERAHWHTFQVLTKRSKALLYGSLLRKCPPNVWLGVTVENASCADRINDLRNAYGPDTMRFLSCEPLLGDLPNIDLRSINWVICGGESQPGCRPMNLDWARTLRDACVRQGVPFFLKQLGGYPNKRHNEKALLDGKLWRQMPSAATQRAIDRKDKLAFL